MAFSTRTMRRSVVNRMLGGVCGGMGEYFGIDPYVVRAIGVVLCFFTAIIPCFVLYLVLWAIIPERDYV